MVELDIELSGSDSYAARFGESIANLGDIDNDGFEGKYKNYKLGFNFCWDVDRHYKQGDYGRLKRLWIADLTIPF